MNRVLKVWQSNQWLAAVLTFGCFAVSCPADEPGKPDSPREELLLAMTARARATEVTIKGSDVKPEFVPKPVFRYDDQQRRFIDATMWTWTIGGRPVAFEKLEAKFNHRNPQHAQWGYCFVSVAADPVKVTWPRHAGFQFEGDALKFERLEKAPAVADHDAPRKRQAKELARQFAARLTYEPPRNQTAEMRLLTTPIYEYSDPQTGNFVGAVYGFCASGTNPDLLIMLEPRMQQDKLAWSFAPVRMTGSGVALKYIDQTVWQVDWIDGTTSPFSHWAFFAVDRNTPRTTAPAPGPAETPNPAKQQ